jgi:8-oxo-dGTP diphosphatase
MSNISSPAHGVGQRRHKLTGDVHLLLIDRNGQALFGRRQNTGFEDGTWHVPAGHLEAGESVVQALIREAKEEVDVRPRMSISPTSCTAHQAVAGPPSSSSSGIGAARQRTASRRSAPSLPGSPSMFCLTT